MKKIIVSLLALVFLFIGQSVFATSIWNNGSQGPECPDINIASGSNGWGSPCWNGTNINVQPGSTISVKIYYHNASGNPGITATDTHIKVIPSSGSSTSHSFTGQILSPIPGGNLYTSSVTANVSPAQTLTYSSTTWYIQNSSGTMTQTPLLNGQNGSEVISSSGLYIGNIVPGWANSQGAIVVNFIVGSSTPPPPQNCSINNFTASPTSIQSGGSSTLNWNTTNCTSASISTIGNVALSGNQSVSPNYTTTYTLTAYGSSGLPTTLFTTVTVSQQQVCSINNFTASPTSIQSGGSSTLNWNTTNCTSASISTIGNVALSGNQSVSPNYTTTYTLTAYGSSGLPVTQSQTVVVNQSNNSCYISYFRGNPNSIERGDTATLSWGTSGDCTSANINRSVGSVSPSGGSRTVYPDYTTSYTLTVYGNNGYSDSSSVTIYVDENNYNYNYYNNNCSISYFNVSPTTINYGGLSTLSWATNNCTSVSISNIGSVNAYGSQTVYPTGTTNYTIYAYNSNGASVTRTVQVYVNNYVVPVTPIYNTCAVTTVATNIGQNSVTLNGLVTNSNSYGANTYFEYGKTVSLGSQTNPRTVSGSSTFSEVLTGLSSNTIYFYRLVSNCNNGIGKGSIEIFQTQGVQQTQTITRTIIKQGTTVIGTESPIMLKIENRYQSFRVGDNVDYTVTYKNISNRTLTHPLLQVVLPKGVAFLNSSRGTYSSDTYTLTVPLEDLVSNVEGVVYLQGRVDSIDSSNAQIVTTALLVYTARNGAQENAIAYVLNNPIGNSSLGALALLGNLFGFGIISWLLILILILLAILLFRKVYRGRKIE